MLTITRNDCFSGYDFGYLLKILTNQNLPKEESEFFELLRMYFPTMYDVKYLMKSCKNLKGGLQEVSVRKAVVTDTTVRNVAAAHPPFASSRCSIHNKVYSPSPNV